MAEKQVEIDGRVVVDVNLPHADAQDAAELLLRILMRKARYGEPAKRALPPKGEGRK